MLMQERQELQSDAVKLQERYPRSTVAADNEMRGNLSTEQKIHEALLSSRLHLPFLNRSKVGPSNIDRAGKGLFATENIAKGEVITCYPGDALLYEISPLDDEKDSSEDDVDDYEWEILESWEAEAEKLTNIAEAFVIWGNHVRGHDRWDEDAVFDGTESSPPLTSYAVSVDDQYSVMGHPALDDNPAYYGHFANDGAGHLALEKANSQEMGVEMGIARYVLQSQEIANALHKPLDGAGLHMITVATKDIREGEEILVTYGPDYWLGHS